MSRGKQTTISKSRELPKPNEYVLALLGELSEWAYCEEKSPTYKGRWKKEVFQNEAPLDLEIGTGNGYHFAYYANSNPHRNFLGIEIKYKPLIQSIRRALRNESKNMRMLRYNATMLPDLFEEGELDNVMIHFPDPWPKSGWTKHRLIQAEFLETLFKLQKTGAVVEFKTDDRDYFDWSVERVEASPYQVTGLSYDLHRSEFAEGNYKTHFEKLFLRKGQPIHFARLLKPTSDQ